MARIATLRVAPEQIPLIGPCRIVSNHAVLPHRGLLAPVLLDWDIVMKLQAVPGGGKRAWEDV